MPESPSTDAPKPTVGESFIDEATGERLARRRVLDARQLPEGA